MGVDVIGGDVLGVNVLVLIQKAEPIPFLPLPYLYLILNRYPFSAEWIQSFLVVGWPSPGSNSRPSGEFPHPNRVSLTT